MAVSKRVVVIGGGLGGIAAALRLAHLGCRVTLIERNERLGGKMNTWSDHGFTFDTGPSLITMPWIFEELYAVAGERMSDHVSLRQVSPLTRYTYADGSTFDYTTDLPTWLDTVRALDPRDEDGFFRFMKLGADIYELSKATFLRAYPTTPPNRESLRALRHFPVRGAWGNYHACVTEHFRSPYLRQLYDRYPTYVGSSPYLCPATFAIIPYLEFAYAGWYVNGGLYAVIESLGPLLERAGVEIRTGVTVDRIDAPSGSVSSVRTSDGQTTDCDLVIMNGDTSCARGLLAGRHESSLRMEDRSLSGLVMLVGVKKTLDSHVHHGVYFSEDYVDEFGQIFDQRRFPSDPTVYVNMPSRTDRSRVPGEGETLFIMANSPANGDGGWTDSALSSARDGIWNRLVQSGFPDLRSEIVCEKAVTPETLSNRYLMPGGAIYGTHSHGFQKAFLRPCNKDRSIGGLYYVGGSTHPGGGTPMVIQSAKITTELILKHETL